MSDSNSNPQQNIPPESDSSAPNSDPRNTQPSNSGAQDSPASQSPSDAYGQQPYGQSYGQPQHGQSQPVQPPYGQNGQQPINPYGQQVYGASAPQYGENPYAQAPNVQPQYTQDAQYPPQPQNGQQYGGQYNGQYVQTQNTQQSQQPQYAQNGQQPYAQSPYEQPQYAQQPYGGAAAGPSDPTAPATPDGSYNGQPYQQYGNQSYGNQQYGNQPYGNQQYGQPAYNQPYGYGQNGYAPNGYAPNGYAQNSAQTRVPTTPWIPDYQCGFGDAIKRYFLGYVQFSGRSSIREYWWATLFVFVTNTIALFIPVLGTLWGLATILPSIAVSLRRLHDSNRSGWWYLVCAVAEFIGTFLMIIGGISSIFSFSYSYAGMAASTGLGAMSALLTIGGLINLAAFGFQIWLYTRPADPQGMRYDKPMQ